MGILRNTERLSYAKKHNYILNVMARDCGQSEKNSKPLLIDIVVKRACTASWQGTQGKSTNRTVCTCTCTSRLIRQT